VLVFEPLSCANLATLLDMDKEDVGGTIDSLQSVFVVPESESESIQISHNFLADFLTDNTRCTDERFYIEPSALHLELGHRCSILMNGSLTKNICELPGYIIMNSEVDDQLDER